MIIDDDSDDLAVATALDVLELLRRDHDDIRTLFASYEAGVDSLEQDRKQGLAERLCSMLLVNAQLKEEFFYAAARDAVDADALLDEAEVENAVAGELIEQIQAMDPEDALYDAKVKVLGHYVKRHLRDEEDRLFPLAELADLDLRGLGAQLQERRIDLRDEYGLDASE